MIPKRVFWMGVGAVAGAAGVVKAQIEIRERVDALSPNHLVVRGARASKDLGRRAVAGVKEARSVAKQRRDELALGTVTTHESRKLRDELLQAQMLKEAVDGYVSRVQQHALGAARDELSLRRKRKTEVSTPRRLG